MPKPKKSPAFQWYPRDYMSDALVVAMTLEQEGAYRRLIDVCWLENGLPTEMEELWRLAKASSRERFETKLWPLISRKFHLRGKKLQHRRLDRERSKQATWRDRAATGGEAKAKRMKRMAEARKKGTHTEYEWAQILIACGGVCAKCGSQESIVKDHIVPIYRGGSDAADNLQPLCKKCNASKTADDTDFRPLAKQRLSTQQAPENPALLSASASTAAASNKIKSTAAARRPVENSRLPDVGSFGLYVTIAKEARRDSNQQDGSDSISNIAAHFKALCGIRQLAYDSELAARAIDAVLRDEVPA